MQNANRISTICLFAGFAVPVTLWSTLFICARTLGSYSHTSRMVSELGELGTITQRTFTYGLVCCAALSLIFIYTLYTLAKRHKISAWPILIMLTFSFSIGFAGIFPYPTALHGTLGSPAVVLFLSPLLAILLWRSSDLSHGIIPFGLVALLLMLSGFSTFFPDFMPNAVGLKQRAFHLGWSIWFIYLGISFYTKTRTISPSMHSQHA